MTLLAGQPKIPHLINAINNLDDRVGDVESAVGFLDFTYAVQTANQDVSTNTLTDSNTLLFSVGAAERWLFRIDLWTDPLGATTDGWAFKVNLSGGDGRWGILSEENGDGRSINNAYNSPGTVHPAGQPYFLISGSVLGGGSAANCVFQFAQGGTTGPPSAPVRVRPFSMLMAWRVA